MALENWNEFSETVVNYVEQLTASEDPDDVFIANMVKRWITRGTESPRDQVRLSKSIKDILAGYADSPLNGRKDRSPKIPMKLEAYYPFEDRVVSVSYALSKRDQNDGEYRENPCVWSKQAWEDGFGIRLFPRRESVDGRRASFVFYSGQEKNILRAVQSSGVSGKYTNTGLRVNDTIERIWSQVSLPMPEDKKAKETHIKTRMGISKVERVSGKDLGSPDFIITHEGRHREEHGFSITRLFIRDGPRKPTFVIGDNDWILDITKWEPIKLSSWANFQPHFYSDWTRSRNRRDPKYKEVRMKEKLAEFQKKRYFNLRGVHYTEEEANRNPGWFFAEESGC